MNEQQKQEKQPLSQDELNFRQARSMPNRQMRNRLEHLARKSGSNIDAAWAVILNIVFQNSKEAKVGGRMESFLR